MAERERGRQKASRPAVGRERHVERAGRQAAVREVRRFHQLLRDAGWPTDRSDRPAQPQESQPSLMRRKLIEASLPPDAINAAAQGQCPAATDPCHRNARFVDVAEKSTAERDGGTGGCTTIRHSYATLVFRPGEPAIVMLLSHRDPRTDLNYLHFEDAPGNRFQTDCESCADGRGRRARTYCR